MNFFFSFVQFLITSHFVYCRKNDSLTFVAKYTEKLMISEIIHLNSLLFFFFFKNDNIVVKWESLIEWFLPISCSMDDLSISINKSQSVLILCLLLLFFFIVIFFQQRQTRISNNLCAFDGVWSDRVLCVTYYVNALLR